MESRSQKTIAIVGQTAGGKTTLAIELAKKFNGEIICADSRTVYKGMDIGSAKPTIHQQKMVAHHCLDIVYPNERYSVAQFKKDASDAIANIRSRNKVPFLVGGSGLYIDSVLYDFALEKKDIRKIDRDFSLEKMQKIAKNLDLNVPEQTLMNKQHLARFIERNGTIEYRKPTNALIIGVRINKDILYQRIIRRVDKMFQSGLLVETKDLLKKWGTDTPALLTPGYKPVIAYIQGSISLDEAKLEFIQNDKKLAKKQTTWFKRNPDIVWIDDISQAEQLINDYLIQ